jgi:ribosomal protein S18 acetylase RimI-like enzyme
MTTIRIADARDAKALAALAEATFRETFASTNTVDDMDLHCRNSYGEQIQAREITSGTMLTLLCEDAGALVGFAQLRWEHAPECVAGASPGEIQRLYVASEWHGRGVAGRLMESGLEHLAARGSDVAWLGVWERNPRAIAFYRKFGFAEVGEHVFPVGNDPQRDIVMVRPIRR